MKAGEFQDKFGNIITIMGIDGRMSSCTGRSIGPTDPDWPAAKAALDALIAEGDAGWVEWTDSYETKHRIRSNGDGLVQWWRDFDCQWLYSDLTDGEAEAYRKGREVAQAEHEALRVQVRALVEAVENENLRCHRFTSAGQYMDIHVDCWEEITKLAKAVHL